MLIIYIAAIGFVIGGIITTAANLSPTKKDRSLI